MGVQIGAGGSGFVNRIAIAVGAAAALAGIAVLATGWAGRRDMADTRSNEPTEGASEGRTVKNGLAKATFGTGCFWCTEAVFEQLQGVESVVSGYSGGSTPNPTYEQVCSGLSGHAEVVQIEYDPATISFADLLEAFWQTHDPTTLNRQGNDVGPQYRSAIFYHDDEQRRLAEHYKKKLDESGAFRAPIVTEITPYSNFYAAEKYHQGYFAQNPAQPYCAVVIGPKVDKFRKAFKDKLKDAGQAASAH